MSFWNRIEQYFKRHYLTILETYMSKEIRMPQFINFARVKRILVIRQHDQLGDFLLATPVLRALRETFPEARIGILVRAYVADVVYHNPYVDEVLVFYEDLRKWTPKEIWKFFKKLRSGWDLAIVLNTVSHSLTSDLLAHFSKADFILGSEHRVFPGCTRNFFYNLIAPYWEEEKHQTERNLDIVRHIGVDVSDLTEVMALTDEEKENALEALENWGLKEGFPVIGMHIGAGKKGNQWPVNRFANLAQILHDQSRVQIILFWGPHEQDLRQKFIAKIPFEPIQVPPQSLRQLAAFLTHCDVLVCNDTGVMHLAAANQVPLVAIFGPTDPDEWKPVGDQFLAIRGEKHTVKSVPEKRVLALLKQLMGEKLDRRQKPMPREIASLKYNIDDFDISETVIEQYVSSLGRFEKTIDKKKK